mmetsp:Transcript_23189/g.68336  ORF Transcript_23189/g.68336 Transcript_23189/m.68336 type:complete len:251 (-) Transcript_23189:100-852(-)
MLPVTLLALLAGHVARPAAHVASVRIPRSTILAATPAVTVDERAVENDMFLDETQMLAEKAFPIPPDELVRLAKNFLASRGGFGGAPELMSPAFQFAGPVVGPLSKEEFLNAISSVDVAKGFPDYRGEFYDFRVDPFDGNRVWYTARGRGTNSGPFPPFAPSPTGRAFVNPPQACSLTFDPSGLVTKYTIGYVMDRDVGNTGGLGGLYGIAYAIGRPLPFPEAQPWRRSKRYTFFIGVSNVLNRIRGARG